MTPLFSRAAVLALVAALTTLTLVATVASQIYDSNHYALTEATALLAGDVANVDFFEVGIPLDAYFAAAMQRISGRRLIGEFARQWLLIAGGLVISFHLALRMTGSIPATLAVLPLALLILAGTPTYHASKLFFFPAMLWAGWRYLDSPGSPRAAAVAVVTATAFLFRHDYGIYLGAGSVVAFVLARAAHSGRAGRDLRRDAVAYSIAILVVLGPWMAGVLATEGLVAYARARAALYQAPPTLLYAALLPIDPVRAFLPEPAPAPRAGVVAFRWEAEVDSTARQQLEAEFGLRAVARGEDGGRWRYQVADLYDPRLLRLDQYVEDASGFDRDRLALLASGRPAREHTVRWLAQMTVLVPLALLLLGVVNRSRRDIGVATPHLLFAAVFLVLLNLALVRQPSYMVVVAPLTAALSARFVASPRLLLRRATLVLLAATTYAALLWSDLETRFSADGRRATADAWVRLVSSPPSFDSAVFDYIRDCTVPGDRVLITGQSPLHVSYYTNRPIAGGHINWHQGWMRDPEHAARSLALLRSQSVPFAISTHDPVLGDLQRYPEIHAYFEAGYVELPGSDGRVLVEARRQASGPPDHRCFRPEP